jgi:hypothetical protein
MFAPGASHRTTPTSESRPVHAASRPWEARLRVASTGRAGHEASGTDEPAVLGPVVSGMGAVNIVNDDPAAKPGLVIGFALFSAAFLALAAWLDRPLFRVHASEGGSSRVLGSAEFQAAPSVGLPPALRAAESSG